MSPSPVGEGPAEDPADHRPVDPSPAVTGAVPTARSAAIVGLLGIGSLPGMLFCGLGAPLAVIALILAPGPVVRSSSHTADSAGSA